MMTGALEMIAEILKSIVANEKPVQRIVNRLTRLELIDGSCKGGLNKLKVSNV